MIRSSEDAPLTPDVARHGGEIPSPDRIVSIVSPLEVETSASFYAVEHKIGRGSQGHVYRVKSATTGETFAMKYVGSRTQYGLCSSTVMEVSILSALSHPNIVRLRAVVHRAKGKPGEVYVLYDLYHTNLELARTQTRMCTRARKGLLLQMMRGLAYMHDNHVMHRDIKPQNLLVDDKASRLVLADMGMSKFFTGPVWYTNEMVTLWYRPPELLMERKKYTEAIDVWSAGVVMFELMTDLYFSPGIDELEVIQMIELRLGSPTGEQCPEFDGRIRELTAGRSPAFQASQSRGPPTRAEFEAMHLVVEDRLLLDLLSKMLTYSPEDRITARAAEAHPYFDDVRDV